MIRPSTSGITQLYDRVDLEYYVKECCMSVIFKKKYMVSGMESFELLFAVPEYKDQLLIGTTEMHQKGQMINLSTHTGMWIHLMEDYMRSVDINMHVIKENGGIYVYVGENLNPKYDPNTTEKILLLTDIELMALKREHKIAQDNYRNIIGEDK